MKITARLHQFVNHKTLPLLIGAGVVLFGLSGFMVFHSVQAHNQLEEQAHQAQAAKAKRLAQQAAAEKQKKAEAAAKKAKADAAAASAAAQPATDSKTTTTTPTKKYATSSDPRSTAYSTTPPAPNPASFTTKITHNGQVAAGTLISYNANKGEKAYYGGDLVVNPSMIQLTRSGPNERYSIFISAPDGATVNMPSEPWDDTSPYFGIAADSQNYKSSGTSFEMFVDHNTLPSAGIYTLHLHTNRADQGADAWYYDYFLTIQVYN